MSNSFTSCIPALLRQLQQDNPGNLPLSCLAVLGALAVREQQLEQTEQAVSSLAMESLTMLAQMEKAGQFMTEANARVVQLSEQVESLQNCHEAKHRVALAYEHQYHEANREIQRLRDKLEEAHNKLACIEAVTRKRDDPFGGGGTPSAALLQ